MEDGEDSFQDNVDGDGDDVFDVSIGDDVAENRVDGDGVCVKYRCNVDSKGNESNVDTKQVFGRLSYWTRELRVSYIGWWQLHKHPAVFQGTGEVLLLVAR